jgi:pyruvate/2-oxoglutarate dehydrogenase complex dihydrolipoamide dehydrogenase (E3) component
MSPKRNLRLGELLVGKVLSDDANTAADNLRVDLGQMMKQKEKSVNGLTAGVESLMKKNKIDYLKGIILI